MSYRGRQNTQKHAAPAHRKPLEGQPVVNHYSEAREVACAVCEVPYGPVAVGGIGKNSNPLFSREMLPEGGDRSCFTDRRMVQNIEGVRTGVRNLVKEWESDPDSIKTPPFPGQGERLVNSRGRRKQTP